MLTNLLFFTAMILLTLIVSRAGSQRPSLKPVRIKTSVTHSLADNPHR